MERGRADVATPAPPPPSLRRPRRFCAPRSLCSLARCFCGRPGSLSRPPYPSSHTQAHAPPPNPTPQTKTNNKKQQNQAGDESAAVSPLASGEFDETISAGFAIVDCYTDWCGPCKLIAPKFAELAEQHADVPSLAFYSYNAQLDPKRSSALNIKALPTFLAFKDGVEVGRMTGSKKEELARFVAEYAAAASKVPAGAVAA